MAVTYIGGSIPYAIDGKPVTRSEAQGVLLAGTSTTSRVTLQDANQVVLAYQLADQGFTYDAALQQAQRTTYVGTVEAPAPSVAPSPLTASQLSSQTMTVDQARTILQSGQYAPYVMQIAASVYARHLTSLAPSERLREIQGLDTVLATYGFSFETAQPNTINTTADLGSTGQDPKRPGSGTVPSTPVTAPPAQTTKQQVAALAKEASQPDVMSYDQWNYYYQQVTGKYAPAMELVVPGVDRGTAADSFTLDQWWERVERYGVSMDRGEVPLTGKSNTMLLAVIGAGLLLLLWRR